MGHIKLRHMLGRLKNDLIYAFVTFRGKVNESVFQSHMPKVPKNLSIVDHIENTKVKAMKTKFG